MPKVTDKLFERKFIALGRLLSRWSQIMGEELAGQAQPLKIRYSRPHRKGDPVKAVLDVAVSSSHALQLAMRKGVLLEKINQIYGESLITDIRFIHVAPARLARPAHKPVRLTEEQKNTLSALMNTVEDTDIRARLTAMGEALLKDQN